MYGKKEKKCECLGECVESDSVNYVGPNLPGTGIQTNTNLTTSLEMIDTEILNTKEELFNLINTPPLYKVYTALIQQSGTNNPTAIVLQNTLGGLINWTRNTQGVYTGTLAGAFTTDKTILLNGGSSNTSISIYSTNPNSIIINTTNFTYGQIDGAMASPMSIEIRVYH